MALSLRAVIDVNGVKLFSSWTSFADGTSLGMTKDYFKLMADKVGGQMTAIQEKGFFGVKNTLWWRPDDLMKAQQALPGGRA